MNLIDILLITASASLAALDQLEASRRRSQLDRLEDLLTALSDRLL